MAGQMPYIRTIPDDGNASGILARVYKAARERTEVASNIITLMSLDERVLQGSMGLYVASMKSRNVLSSARKEMLATVVSNINLCYY
ncbi:MAG: hypothetical protein ACR2GY_14185 [Phycisphaerales bacterium]